jgi:hypothetical protein
MDKVKIWEWLKAKKYQTEYEYTGEYRMYFDLDMPKILEDYWKYKANLLGVICCETCYHGDGDKCHHPQGCETNGEYELWMKKQANEP